MKKHVLYTLCMVLSLWMASCHKEKVEPTYAVAFDMQGKGTPIDTIYVENGSLITKPSNPTEELYVFEGWYKDAEFTTSWNFDNDKVSGNTTLYAKWIFNGCIVEFNTNELVSVPNAVIEKGSLLEEPTPPLHTFYTFEGWFKDSEFSTEWNFDTDRVTENTTLYAKWEVKKHCCVIFYRTQLSGVTVPNDTVDYQSLITTRPADPESDDYIFNGWYKDKSCTKPWDFEKDSVTQKTTNLFGKWSPKYYYYGAELYSQETFKYGRFEAKMKMAYAPGCVSSMFLYYNNSDKGGNYIWNEIDIEVLGKDINGFQSNIITGKAGAQITSETMHKTSTPPNSEYHTYIIEWTPEYVSWIVDGEELRRTEIGATKQQIEAMNGDEKQSLRFNLWIPNTNLSWVGPFSSTNLPIMQYIDYIKVYDYNTETKEFTERWTDDFDSFNSTRWNKGDWKMDQSWEKKDNVTVEDGNLVLHLTKVER